MPKIQDFETRETKPELRHRATRGLKEEVCCNLDFERLESMRGSVSLS